MPAQDWDQVLAVDLGGFYNVLQPLTLPMARRRGRIVVMSSVSGISGTRGQTNYSAAKAGSSVRPKRWPQSLQAVRLRSMSLPRAYRHRHGFGGRPRTHSPYIPMRRLGSPDEVAAVAAFLLFRRRGLRYPRRYPCFWRSDRMKLPQTARRVVITGMSAISPLGSSWTDVRSALLHNRSGIQHMTEWEDLQGTEHPSRCAGRPFELDPEFFTRKRMRSMGRGSDGRQNRPRCASGCKSARFSGSLFSALRRLFRFVSRTTESRRRTRAHDSHQELPRHHRNDLCAHDVAHRTGEHLGRLRLQGPHYYDKFGMHFRLSRHRVGLRSDRIRQTDADDRGAARSSTPPMPRSLTRFCHQHQLERRSDAYPSPF